MKKIALIIDSLDKSFSKDGIRGGGNKVSRHLILEWAKNSDITLDVYSSPSFINTLDGVHKIINLDWNLYGNRDKFFLQIQEYLMQENYDAIIFNDIFSEFGNLILNCNSLLYRYKNGKNCITNFFLKILNHKKISYQKEKFKDKNRKFFVVSNIVKDDYLSNFDIPEDNIITVYPGVEMPSRIENKISNKIFTIGMANSGGSNKGAYLLINVLKKLKKKKIDFKLKMIYPKYKRDFFLKFFIKLNNLENNIEIYEFQKDMSDFYRSIDCLLLPSMNEAFGLVVLEAASFGTLSLTSSTAGVSELIKDSNNGFVFSMENKEKNLMNKLEHVINIYYNSSSEFKKIQDNAYKLAETYTWKKFAQTISDNLP